MPRPAPHVTERHRDTHGVVGVTVQGYRAHDGFVGSEMAIKLLCDNLLPAGGRSRGERDPESKRRPFCSSEPVSWHVRRVEVLACPREVPPSRRGRGDPTRDAVVLPSGFPRDTRPGTALPSPLCLGHPPLSSAVPAGVSCHEEFDSGPGTVL